MVENYECFEAKGYSYNICKDWIILGQNFHNVDSNCLKNFLYSKKVSLKTMNRRSLKKSK